MEHNSKNNHKNFIEKIESAVMPLKIANEMLQRIGDHIKSARQDVNDLFDLRLRSAADKEIVDISMHLEAWLTYIYSEDLSDPPNSQHSAPKTD